VGDRPLAETLTAELAARGRAEPPTDELERALADAYAEGRARWPGVVVPADGYVRYLVPRLPAEPLPGALARLCCADLYLACAVAAGDEAAIATFETELFREVAPVVGRIHRSQALADDVAQTLRMKLIVRANGQPGKIADFTGAGPLRGWFRSVVLREAISVRRRHWREQAAPPADLESAADGVDVALDYMKQIYRADFAAAFRDAFTSLPARDRRVLRSHVLDRLTSDDLALVYGVHRATAARWVTRARELLRKRTRYLLATRLAIATEELDAIVALTEAQLHISMSALLRTEPAR
jgi:RNA polymerase sigma-70 factor (ECF subfamily)